MNRDRSSIRLLARRYRTLALFAALACSVLCGCTLEPPPDVRRVLVKVSLRGQEILEGSFGVRGDTNADEVWQRFLYIADEERALLRPTEAFTLSDFVASPNNEDDLLYLDESGVQSVIVSIDGGTLHLSRLKIHRTIDDDGTTRFSFDSEQMRSETPTWPPR